MAFGRKKDGVLPEPVEKEKPEGNKRLKKKDKENKKEKKKTDGGKKEKKPGTPLKGAAAVILFFVLLFGVASSLFYFELFGARDVVIELLGVTNEASQRKEEKLTEWETNLQRDAQNLAEDEKKLKNWEKEIAEREAAVKDKEEELHKKIAAFEETTAQLSPNNNDINTVVKVVENMGTDAASAMLMEMKDRDAMLHLFSLLKPATKAAILETLDAKEAASLVEKLS